MSHKFTCIIDYSVDLPKKKKMAILNDRKFVSNIAHFMHEFNFKYFKYFKLPDIVITKKNFQKNSENNSDSIININNKKENIHVFDYSYLDSRFNPKFIESVINCRSITFNNFDTKTDNFKFIRQAEIIKNNVINNQKNHLSFINIKDTKRLTYNHNFFLSEKKSTSFPFKENNIIVNITRYKNSYNNKLSFRFNINYYKSNNENFFINLGKKENNNIDLQFSIYAYENSNFIFKRKHKIKTLKSR